MNYQNSLSINGFANKMIISALFTLISGSLSFAQSQINPLPQLKNSSLETSYIPFGFDSNDSIQIVVEGVYRNTCSKPAGTRFKVNPTTNIIEIMSYEYSYQGPCLDVLVPHNEVVVLGVLPAGTYKVMQSTGKASNGGQLLGQLFVGSATKAAADDYLYAPISQAYLRNQGNNVIVTISGNFTNSCMELNKVIPSVQPKVITIQPIATLNSKSTNCVSGYFPFEKSFAIDNVKPGRYLLHVRSLNGNSINSLFDVK